MAYQPIIFPTLVNKTWGEVNLNEIAQKEFSNVEKENKLLNPEFCDEWVKKIAQKHHVDFTWGGHFEDRKHLWRGYYTESKKVTHLGVDYNVPSGTEVVAPRNCEVVHVWADTNLNNGWGGRVILKLETPWENAPYLVLGHLAHKSLPQLGKTIEKGQFIATTGVPIENGGWFPHLHVQCVNVDYFQAHLHDLTLLDGYYLMEGKPYDLAPDPTLLVGIHSY